MTPNLMASILLSSVTRVFSLSLASHCVIIKLSYILKQLPNSMQSYIYAAPMRIENNMCMHVYIKGYQQLGRIKMSCMNGHANIK